MYVYILTLLLDSLYFYTKELVSFHLFINVPKHAEMISLSFFFLFTPFVSLRQSLPVVPANLELTI